MNSLLRQIERKTLALDKKCKALYDKYEDQSKRANTYRKSNFATKTMTDFLYESSRLKLLQSFLNLEEKSVDDYFFANEVSLDSYLYIDSKRRETSGRGTSGPASLDFICLYRWMDITSDILEDLGGYDIDVSLGCLKKHINNIPDTRLKKQYKFRSRLRSYSPTAKYSELMSSFAEWIERIESNTEDTTQKDMLLKAEKKELDLNTGFGFFPTPEELADSLIGHAELDDNKLTVLEPSAGTGNIVEAIYRRNKDLNVECCELNPKRREFLSKQGYKVIDSDFFDIPVDKKWDRIIMNPPFENGLDIDHIRHAFSHLAEGGILVSLASSSIMTRQEKKWKEFAQWLTTQSHDVFGVAQGSFKESGTGVSCVIIKIHN